MFGFLFQYPVILPFHTVHGVLKGRILKWFAIPFSSGPYSVRPLHHDPSFLGGPTLACLSFIELDKAVVHVIRFSVIMVCVSVLWFLLQHPSSYLGFSYLGHEISFHSCSSKVQPLLPTLDEGYLLMAAPPDFEHGVAPLHPLAPTQPLLLGRGIAPLGHCPWPRARVACLQLPPHV